MTASLLAKQWPQADITLIESPNIPTVGVGEGSTPYIRHLFKTLDISEAQWMSKCNATFKNGITFKHWSIRKGFESYFHPFLSQYDDDVTPLFAQHTRLRRHGYPITCHPDNYYLTKELTNQRKSCQLQDSSNPVETLYAYHFDAEKLGLLLKEKSLALGVNHLLGNISQVKQAENGDIASVVSDEQGELSADIFVDCTGFKALLMQKTLNTPFVSYSDNLFNDSAVAIASPKIDNYSPQTVSTALSNGWAWHIPLQNRVGNGYVYSAKYQTADSAEQELRHFIGQDRVKDVEARHIKMRVGRSEKHWNKNCLAVGLSQGFIEPLEATALHLVQDTIESFIAAIEEGKGTTAKQDYFNDKINYAFERVRDYIVTHYISNSRNDTPYWQDCRKIPVSDSLQRILYAWFNGMDVAEELDLQQISQYYPSASWHALLAGVGTFPEPDPSKTETFANEIQQIQHRRDELAKLFKNL
ncbi:tryptophan 7-halogenase [Saccharobesus litoralis]|uniref:Tryptophan 7-halogenase n=2 Tax=Saccharobesus litoralis TaxID=2172099 RepID=A0A2S0VN87_9ALTE|nr:tryptophan 7-halogenase [Saccharobesus litoralis]